MNNNIKSLLYRDIPQLPIGTYDIRVVLANDNIYIYVDNEEFYSTEGLQEDDPELFQHYTEIMKEITSYELSKFSPSEITFQNVLLEKNSEAVHFSSSSADFSNIENSDDDTQSSKRGNSDDNDDTQSSKRGNSDKNSKTLTVGEIIGIVICSVVILSAIIVGVILGIKILEKKKKSLK